MPEENPVQQDDEFELASLKSEDKVSGIKVGDESFVALKMFLTKKAKHYEERSLARTYILRSTATQQLVGYATLVCGEIFTKEDPEAIEHDSNYTYDNSPGVKIARLLVDHRFRGRGIGEALVQFAIGRAKKNICPTVGCRFIIVDAKKESVGFYKKCGFSLLKSAENENSPQPLMFLDLHKAQ